MIGGEIGAISEAVGSVLGTIRQKAASLFWEPTLEIGISIFKLIEFIFIKRRNFKLIS